MKRLFLAIAVITSAFFSLPCQAQTITWATFNIRYDNPADQSNNWQFRKDTVTRFIQAQDMDIVGMQEVLHNQLEDLLQRLPGYKSIGVGRDDGKTKGEYAPILYKEDRFEVLDSNTFWLSQYPDSIGFIGWDGACTRIATWAKMKDRQSGKIIMAVNTHFDHVGVTARWEGALLIIRKIKEIVGDRPAVLTGDFNVNDQSEAYRTITSNAFVLKDAAKIAGKQTGVDYTFHNFGQIPSEQCEKIDYIFVTPQIKVLDSFIPKEAAPGSKFLSDHNPQIVHLIL